MTEIILNGNHRKYGGVKMRGRALAERFGWPLRGGPLPGRFDTVVAMKLGYDPDVRRKCRRLIWDPVDAFHPRPRWEPAMFWRRSWHALRFDEIIATSPACAASMADALPESVKVHVVPHHHDPGLSPAHNPDGPVVYAGLGRYIDRKLPVIREACRQIGREFVWGRSQTILIGASLALVLRCPPTDTRLNRCCKPQIKVENAAAVGLPIVCTDCPATLSLHPQLRTTAVPSDFDVATLTEAMRRAAAAGPVCQPYAVDDFLHDMARVLEIDR